MCESPLSQKKSLILGLFFEVQECLSHMSKQQHMYGNDDAQIKGKLFTQQFYFKCSNQMFTNAKINQNITVLQLPFCVCCLAFY